MANKIFSVEKNENHITLKFFGIKYSYKNSSFIKQEEKKQNSYDLSQIKNANSLVVFLLPAKRTVNGGIQSIYSLCKYSREIANVPCVLSTIPGKQTYSHNPYFENNENVHRWEQIINNLNAEKLIIHIPEIFADSFYKLLTKNEIEKLKSVKDLQINILNQNIEQMPSPRSISDLYNLTGNITQTIAHNSYATQEVADKYNIPTHLFSVYIDISQYKSYEFENKEKTIVLSPDINEYRDDVVEKLKKEMPDFKLVTVQNLTFSQYMDLIARSYFTITFGEGMDGYFLQPHCVGSLGFAVYNSEFFPNEDWKKLKQTYFSYYDMIENITDDLKEYYQNKELYYSMIEDLTNETKKIYSFDGWLDNLRKFYNRNYDFLPTTKRNK